MRKDLFDDLELIRDFVTEISKVDPDSQSCRYPSDRHGNPFFNSGNAPIIDMNHFAKIVSWIISDLDTLQDMIDEQYQQRCAALNEMSSD